jgi:hypothetical protein
MLRKRTDRMHVASGFFLETMLMLKGRIAVALAGTLVAGHYAIAAGPYGSTDSMQLRAPQTNDASYPRDANTIYGRNRSDPGVRETWGELRGFPPSDDLVGQRPLPAQERYFAQHEQQTGARSCGIAAAAQEQPAYC